MLNPIYVHLSTVKESPYPVLTGCPCDTVEIAGAMLAYLVRKYQSYGKVYSATAISLHISNISVLPKIGLFTRKNQTCHWRILWRTRYISWMLVNTFFFLVHILNFGSAACLCRHRKAGKQLSNQATTVRPSEHGTGTWVRVPGSIGGHLPKCGSRTDYEFTSKWGRAEVQVILCGEKTLSEDL